MALVRSCVILIAVLLKCVLSVPVSSSNLDDEDVKVIKCIVEVLADVLSKPHSIPVSQQCLDTLRTDDRLVTILRHHNFLQELQDIALEGANERSEKRTVEEPDHAISHPSELENTADRSMLVAMERPGEAAERRDAEKEEEEEEEEEGGDTVREERKEGSHEHNDITSHEKRNKVEEKPDNHILDPLNEEQEGEKEEKRDMMEEEEKHSSLEEEEEEEEDETADAKAPNQHSKAKNFAENENQKKRASVEKKRAGSGQLEDEMVKFGPKRWSPPSRLAYRRAEMSTGSHEQQEVPHHSKEVPSQEEEVWKSPEEQELQMMVRRDPEDRREEEGSASKKTEDPEMESLAVIESELENVARKLHDLRRG